MNTTTQHPPTLQPQNRKKKVLITLAVTALLIITAGASIYWWQNRPITPTVLNASEQSALDQKIASVHQHKPTYQPGEKTITLSEREVNALFHHNTGLGDKVKFEFANNAIHARIRTELDSELPIVGGHTLVAKARFLLKDNNNHAAIILDDVTVWGISLPNAWLGDFKGQNLISDIGLDAPENQFSRGIKNIKIQNGSIFIELAD